MDDNLIDFEEERGFDSEEEYDEEEDIYESDQEQGSEEEKKSNASGSDAETDDEEESENESEEEDTFDTPQTAGFDISKIKHANMTNFEFAKVVTAYAELLVERNLDPVIESDLTDIIEIAFNDVVNAREKIPFKIIRRIGNEKISIPLEMLGLPRKLVF